MTNKRDLKRHYPPELVSADSLAYLLDCARTTIDDYVRRGLLPRPIVVGNLKRWRWREVVADVELASQGDPVPQSHANEYLKGLKHAEAEDA